MRRDDDYESSDVEDRRSDRRVRAGDGSEVGLLLNLIYWLGWRRGLVVFGLIAGGSYLLNSTGLVGRGAAPAQHAGHDKVRAFVGYVLDDIQRSWAARIPGYRNARVVLYADETSTGCGEGEAAVGPFYCPRDERVYLDATFFEELRDRLGAPGDFAQAYVIAHELGHHLQKLDGTSARVDASPRARLQGEGGLSVRLELQADCYAGVWAASAEKRGLLQPGDLEQAVAAAAAVGDDRLQRQARGTVQPEKWTHGSSAERQHWFRAGHDAADPRACDTFR